MNYHLPSLGKLRFTNNGVEYDGDFSVMAGREFLIQPIKSQARTILSEIANITDCDGNEYDKTDVIFNTDMSVEDTVASLISLNNKDREITVNAIKGADSDRYDEIVVYVSSRIPGQINFLPVEDDK